MGPQKRLVVVTSDEEEDAILPNKRKQRNSKSIFETAKNDIEKHFPPTRSRANPPAHAENESPPKRPTRESRASVKPQGSKPISTFFNAANKPPRSKCRSPEVANPVIEDEVEDLIEDDSLSEKLEDLPEAHNAARSILDRPKRPREDTVPNGSQQFKPVSTASRNRGIRAVIHGEVDSRPWADKFGPNNLDELAIHKRKVSDVRDWLQKAFQDRNRMRLLILKGPSGAGKTTTISVLAKTMGFDLSEWMNPTGSEYMSEGYVSMSAQFEDFMGRSGRFGELNFLSTAERVREITKSDEQGQYHRRKVVLLEEFPSIFMSSFTALQSFRSSISEYLAASTPSSGTRLSKNHLNCVTPLVMVITETRLMNTAAANDSFTAHKLLGSEVLNHPGVSVIEFNPIAPTLLAKALDLVIHKEARQSGRRRMPGPLVLKRLGEVGDVRSAIGSLEFLCVRGDNDQSWSGRVASRATKAYDQSSVISVMERESLEMITQRESSLGLFHAIGKVVYNKRDDSPTILDQPPHHMSEHVRSRVSQVSVESLFDEKGTDTGTFIAALHENYVLSCEGVSFIDTISNCLDALSDSDILDLSRASRFNPGSMYGNRLLQGMATDSLQQDQICFQLAVRGLLFALPDPVKRRAYPVTGRSGGKNDTYKMFYPTSIRLARQVEEITDCLDRWTGRLRTSVVLSGEVANPYSQHIVGMKSGSKDPGSNRATTHPHKVDKKPSETIRTCLGCTKAELILERLPYVTKIEQRIQTSSQLRELEKITRFHGTHLLNEESSENEDTDEPTSVVEYSTDRPAEMKTKSPTSVHQGARRDGRETTTFILSAEQGAEKMYLSDDDIED